MNEKAEDFEKMINEMREEFKKNLLMVGVIILGTFIIVGEFTKLNAEPPQEIVVYDEKTNIIYTTDEQTYKEWEKNPYRDNYPFHLDNRFHKQGKKFTQNYNQARK